MNSDTRKNNKNDALIKLENQICFPLYAASRLMTKLYKPFLDELDLTYPQYLVMMVLWETDNLEVKNIGKKLFLNSNTLTPLLKKLEMKSYINRIRSEIDERNMFIKLSDQGKDLKQYAIEIPCKLMNKLFIDGNIELSEGELIKKLLNKLIDSLDNILEK